MSIFQSGKIKTTVKLFAIFLAAVLAGGCVAQKNVKTSSQTDENNQKPSAVQTAAEPRQLNLVKVESQEGNILVQIMGNRKLVYTSLKQSFPFGIAIYLPETKLAYDFKKSIPETSEGISSLTVTYADEDQTTVKIEILLSQDFGYVVLEGENSLNVVLEGSSNEPLTMADKGPAPASSQTAVSEGEGRKVQEIIESEEEKKRESEIIIPDKTAAMTNIEFNTFEDGRSDIFVQTSHPVKYDIRSEDGNTLFLNLYNTVIPDYHKRPIVTEYFKSAVERLMPVQIPGSQKNSFIKINLREQVPYRIVRGENSISMFFEPSSIEPPVFEKARKELASGTEVKEMETVSPVSDQEIQAQEQEIEKEPAQKKTLEEEVFGPKKLYTGEKIQLDFYETDIKNVFRILRSVGKLNFAIDKNVSGKVTLTLEEPVPWDQVLDLVLKMNNLGMKKEGNVIRIATLDTLKKEEKLFQDAIEAKKKSMEQQKIFEPLVTEYIPINYSDAEADIKPHIDQILSKDRGKISVDKRTNMIIITDTQAKIDQARDIIYRLDKVTPQIMIEAKVVEVTKSFSQELGLGLTFSQSRTSLATSGTDRSFDVALNSPSGATSGTFNFWRIFGSDHLSLVAQLAAAETKGDVKVVSSPRILTIDNKLAKIKQGLEYAYLERDDTGGSSVKFKNIDLLLEVTPHVTPDRRVAMTVHLTKNDLQSVTSGVPSLSTNEAETELLVNNNDTIVIGGIVKTTDNDSTTGTPILSGIPIVGRLFRTDTDTKNRNELLIFITPSIVQLDQKRNSSSQN